MPCTPAKARHLLKSGVARPKRNKLGLFYLQLCYEQEPAGIDPGSKFEGYSVVGTKETVFNLMAEAPAHVKEAVEVRRNMRRASRQGTPLPTRAGDGPRRSHPAGMGDQSPAGALRPGEDEEQEPAILREPCRR